MTTRRNMLARMLAEEDRRSGQPQTFTQNDPSEAVRNALYAQILRDISDPPRQQSNSSFSPPSSLLGSGAERGIPAGATSEAGMPMGGDIFGSGLASEWGGGSAGSASGGGMSSIAGTATPALFAALIGAGKTAEHNNPNSWYGRMGLSLLGPSGKQVLADPKLALAGPFAGLVRNDKAAKAKPEWMFWK